MFFFAAKDFFLDIKLESCYKSPFIQPNYKDNNRATSNICHIHHMGFHFCTHNVKGRKIYHV